MTDFNILRARKDVRYTSSINPTVSDGTIIGEIWQVTVAPYEKFCLIDRINGESAWIGTQGTNIFPVDQGFLAQIYLGLGGTENTDNDYTNTEGTNYDIWYSQYAPTYPELFYYFYSPTPVVHYSAQLNGTINGFDPSRIYIYYASEGNWSPDRAYMDIEFQDTNGNALFWIGNDAYGSYGNRMLYGLGDLRTNTVTAATITSPYPRCSFYTRFVGDTMQFTQTSQPNTNYFHPKFTITLPAGTVANIAKVRFSNLQMVSTYTGATNNHRLYFQKRETGYELPEGFTW